MIREKQTRAGKLLSVDFYPCWPDGRRMPTQSAEKRGSSEAQQKYNRNKAVKEAIMLINENFDNSDNVLSLTFKPENAPQSVEELQRIVTNYLRRIKRLRKKELIRISAFLDAMPNDKIFDTQRSKLTKQKAKLEEPLKYFFTREEETYKRGQYAGRKNYHPHIFLTGGIDRTVLKKMWPYGTRCNADRFQPERFGPEAMEKYIMKDPQGARSYCCSKNLTRKYRTPKIKDGKYTARQIKNYCTERVDDALFWEKKYKGYRFLRSFPRFNEYNGQWYMSVVMYADCEIMPKWEFEHWPSYDW